jgi:anti-anti-sigma factor
MRAEPAPIPLGIRTRRVGSRYVVALSGRLDRATRGSLADTLDQALDEDNDAIVLDLADLQLIDEAGVRTILLAHLRSSDEHRQFLVVPGREAVQRIIDQIEGPFRYIHE